MTDVPLILAIDDSSENLDILRLQLEAQGYRVETADNGETGLTKARELRPDLVLLDLTMPDLDGFTVVRRLKGDPDLPLIPVIFVTARSDTRDLVRGFDAGGDDFLTKPFEFPALLARIRAMLRMKASHDEATSDARTLEGHSRELAAWNGELEDRVAEQGAQLQRMTRLRRFVPSQVADLVVAGTDGASDPLARRRRDVTVLFADLRGFTAFAESTEPGQLMTVLEAYHGALGELIVAHAGTLERFVGDGVVVVFNDPVPQADHTERALRLALAMRDRIATLVAEWRSDGHQLGFGIGIARGEAILGGVGFEHKVEYSVIGAVPNLASRLCDTARDGQILICGSAHSAAKASFDARALGDLSLKGFRRPVPAYELQGSIVRQAA